MRRSSTVFALDRIASAYGGLSDRTIIRSGSSTRSPLALSVIAFDALDSEQSSALLRPAYSHRIQESPLTGGASRNVRRAAIRLPG